MSLVRLYKNGSYKVQINTKSGTRYYFGNTEFPDFPDSIDLKITQWCPWGCKFCYESAGTTGKHANTGNLLKILGELPKVPLEVAIGGGSAPDHPEFKEIKDFIISRGNIANLTVTQRDLDKLDHNVFSGISGLGVSIGSELIIDPSLEIPQVSQIVFHVISGITPIRDIEKLVDTGKPILVLGFKKQGRASSDNPDLKPTERFVKSILGKVRMVFDDLAVKQLRIRDAVLEKDWKIMYQGPEFSHSMFVDAVEEKFYPSSTDRDRGISWDKINITNYFKKYHVRDSQITSTK